MERILNVVYPAENYVPGGEAALVQLSCNSLGYVVKNEVTKVLLLISVDPDFTVSEVTAWGLNVIYATKIFDTCSNTSVYVANYINDILPWVNCCAPDSQIPDDTFYLITEDGQNILLENGSPIIV